MAERHLGPIADRRCSFGEAAPVERLLRDTGFRDVRSCTASHTVRFLDGTVFVRLNATALIGMSEAGKRMGDDERCRVVAAITRDSADVVRQQTDEEGFALKIRANVTTARG